MNCKKCAGLMELYIHEDLSKPDRKSFEEHLNSCKECSLEFSKIKQVVSKIGSITGDIPVPDWDKSWRSIKKNIGKKPERKKFFLYFPSFNWRLAVVYSIFIFFLGLAAGKILFFSPQGGKSQGSAITQDIQVTIREYFEDIKPVVLEYANYQPIYKNIEDITFDKTVARKLLTRNRILQYRVPKVKNAKLQQLLEELEVILMEISNLNYNESENLQMIKELIKIKKTIFKLENLYLNRIIKTKI